MENAIKENHKNKDGNDEVRIKFIQDIPEQTTDNFKIENSNIKNNSYENVNAEILLSKLSPEVTANEKAKRKHKTILIILLTSFIMFQFITVYFMSNKVIDYATSENTNYNILKLLFTFISGYITSVIIELIAILNYIVKNVFDTSIYDLVKIFKQTKEETS